MEVVMAMIDRDETRFQDWINLAIGAVLAISPWVFGFSAQTTPTQVAVGSGILVALVAVAALVRFAEWEEWLNMLLGIAIAVSPFVFGFTGEAMATQTMFIGGILVVLMAGWEVWSLHHAPETIR
jgi:hypothetical protein